MKIFTFSGYITQYCITIRETVFWNQKLLIVIPIVAIPYRRFKYGAVNTLYKKGMWPTKLC